MRVHMCCVIQHKYANIYTRISCVRGRGHCPHHRLRSGFAADEVVAAKEEWGGGGGFSARLRQGQFLKKISMKAIDQTLPRGQDARVVVG